MKFHDTILKYPKVTIGVVLLVTLFFGWHMRKVKLNNSIEELLPENHPSVLQDKELKHVFNSREMILIGVLNNQGIFNPTTLQKVKDLTEKLWQVDIVQQSDVQPLQEWGKKVGGRYDNTIRDILSNGLTVADRGPVSNLLVEARNDKQADPEFISFLENLQLTLSPLSDVISLAEVDNITSTEWGLSVDPPMKIVPQTEEGLAKLRAAVYDNEMFINSIVSKDGTGTLILAELSFYYDDHIDLALQVFEKLKRLVEPYKNPEDIQLAGVPMVNVYTSSYMSGDMARLTPIVMLLVMIIMYFSFRMLKGVFIPLSVVLVALVWTLGVMGLVGRPITLVVSFMPVMILAIGIADGIHLITEYKLLWFESRDQSRAIMESMRRLTWPVILTSLTTMAGFASLASSNLRSIKDFGIYTSVGVFAAMIFSLTFIPAALKLMKPPKVAFGNDKGEQGWLALALGRLRIVAVNYRSWVYIASVALAAVSVLAIAQVRVGSAMAGMFPEESEIYQASKMLNEKFGGTEVMNIVIDTKTKDGLKDPDVLGKIAALQDTLETLPIVGYTSSLADYVKRTNLVMNNNNLAYNRVPGRSEEVTETEWIEQNGKEVEVKRQVQQNGRDLIAQYMLLYENAGGDDLKKLTDFDYSKANIVALIRTDFTPQLKTVMQKAQEFTEANFSSDIEVLYAGCSTLCVVADDLIIPGQLKSLGLAFIVVLVLLSLIFRSLKYGLIALMPMVLTVLLVFLLIGSFGVYLDAVMALIASIVLGIGVDYSVHFLSRYRALRREGVEFHRATQMTLNTSGRSIVFNSLAVASGFFVLLLSSFWPVIHMGWLVAANMVFSAILTMVLLPAVLRTMQHKTVGASEPFQEKVMITS